MNLRICLLLCLAGPVGAALAEDQPPAPPPMVDPLDAGRATALHRGGDPHANLSPRQHLAVAAQHLAAGRYPQALAVLDQAIARYPHEAELFNLRAALALRQNRVRQALADMEQAVKLAPDNPLYRVSRANLYLKFERKDEALSDLDAAVMLAPDLIPARFNRGALLANLGREAEALADFEHCTQVEPELPAPWFNRGAMHWALGQRQAARDDLRHFLELAKEPAWQKAGQDLLRAWDAIEAKEAANSKGDRP